MSGVKTTQPKDATAFKAYIREVKVIHQHQHPVGPTHRWTLTTVHTKLCGTDRCARLVLR